jgi:acetyl-CoA acyltransferase 1
VTVESLSQLKPVFSKTGSTHAGNASQVSDGAAAVLLVRRSLAKKLGLPILGKFYTSAVVGVPPRIMGIGPLYAVKKLLEKCGIRKEEVDFYEINVRLASASVFVPISRNGLMISFISQEAFASQAVYSIKELGIPFEKVNPVGGAIAFGHPLGATGARQVATGFAEAKRSRANIFVTSMCIGTGMGMAGLFVNEQA